MLPLTTIPSPAVPQPTQQWSASTQRESHRGDRRCIREPGQDQQILQAQSIDLQSHKLMHGCLKPLHFGVVCYMALNNTV